MDVGVFILVVITTMVMPSEALVKLSVGMQRINTERGTIVVFRCSAGQNEMFFLDHVITWSKIGRDGREQFLSINWDLVQYARNAGYEVASQTFHETSLANPIAAQKLFFVLSKGVLSPEDHGEYFCRLYDFDRNLMGEESLPVVVYDSGIALSPYKVEGRHGKDFAINCMYNNTVQPDDVMVLTHVTNDGVSTRIAENGLLLNTNVPKQKPSPKFSTKIPERKPSKTSLKKKISKRSAKQKLANKLLEQSLAKKFDLVTYTSGDGSKHNVLTIKGPTKSDEGYIVCEMRNKTNVVASTNATISIDTPKLIVSPLYFLQIPSDSIARFQCQCDVNNTEACLTNQLAWSFVNKHTKVMTHIYNGGQVVGNSSLYDVMPFANGSSVNLTIKGVRDNETEGDYICFLFEKNSTKEIAHASIPVSVNPVSLGALLMMHNLPASLQLLCTLSGGNHYWNTHYLETHRLVWLYTRNGQTTRLASNKHLGKSVDKKKYRLKFDLLRYFSILDIVAPTTADHGNYTCQLLSNRNNRVIQQQTLHMYGKGDKRTTIFAGSQGYAA